MLKKIKNIVLKSLIVFAVLIIILGIYFYFAIKIDVPTIANDTTLNWKREQIDTNYYKVNNNFLKQNSRYWGNKNDFFVKNKQIKQNLI